MPRCRSIVLLACALAFTLSGRPAPAQDPDQQLNAEITVFEAQITLDASDLSFRDRQRLKPEQILVLEGGSPRRVTNLQPLGSGGWRFLIYVDAPLTRARTLRLATLRLGENARRLTDLGTVEIVVADPEPRTVLAATREPVPVADQLARIGDSGLGTDEIETLRESFGKIEAGLAAGDPRRAEAMRREVELVRTRVDHLLLRLAEGCAGEPCAVLLVSDGFYEEPEPFYLGERRLADPNAARLAEEASRELAQTAAAYDWIALPLPVREDRLEAPLVARQTTDFDVFLDHTGAVRRAPKRSDQEPTLDLESLEVSVTPVLQPLQRLAVESAGEVVRIADDLEEPLDALPERRRIYYLTDRPLDGEVRSISTRLAATGKALLTPSWVRSSTPAAVAGSRLRAVLGGREPAGGLPLRGRLERGAGGETELVLEADWGTAAELVPKSVIRVSVGYTRAGDLPWVGHQRLAAGEIAADGAWRHRVTVPLPDGVNRLAVVAEAMVPRLWGAALIEPAP